MTSNNLQSNNKKTTTFNTNTQNKKLDTKQIIIFLISTFVTGILLDIFFKELVAPEEKIVSGFFITIPVGLAIYLKIILKTNIRRRLFTYTTSIITLCLIVSLTVFLSRWYDTYDTSKELALVAIFVVWIFSFIPAIALGLLFGMYTHHLLLKNQVHKH